MKKYQMLWLCAVIVTAPHLPAFTATFLSAICMLLAVYFEWKESK